MSLGPLLHICKCRTNRKATDLGELGPDPQGLVGPGGAGLGGRISPVSNLGAWDVGLIRPEGRISSTQTSASGQPLAENLRILSELAFATEGAPGPWVGLPRILV